MSKGTRSAAALAGFVLVAGAQLALVLLALWAVLWMLPSTLALRAGVPLSIATFGALGYATWRALHLRTRLPAGVAVTRDRAPRLWALVDGAAAVAGVAPPDGLTVVADATVTIGERTRLLGLIGGRRDLYLGLPLLQAWDAAPLRAAVTHELAHGSPLASRWAPVAHRGRVVVGRIVPRISRRNPAGAALRAYARIYRYIDGPFSREQELAADRLAASHAGVEAVVTVLRDLPVLAGMQRLFHAEYVGPGWQAGYVPDDVFGGLLRVLAARSAEMAMLREREPEPAGPWDTHPPVAERLAALQTLETQRGDKTEISDLSPAEGRPAEGEGGRAESGPAGGGPAEGGHAESGRAESGRAESGSAEGGRAGEGAAGRGPAEDEGELVEDLPRLGRALQEVAYPARGRTVVGWDECLGVARTAEMEREAEAALVSVSRAVGADVGGPADVLELAADGRLREAARALFPGSSEEETTERIVDLLGLVLALAALRSGVVRWRHSWTGAAEVVGVDGAYLNLAELARAAAEPRTVEDVRAYLDKIGVDLAARAGDGGPARSRVLGGLINLTADGARTDLLITDLGLLLVPGLPRGHGNEAKRRLARIAADGVPARPEGESGGRFLAFADVTSVTAMPGRRKGWVVGVRGGSDVTVRPALDTDELPGGWQAWEDAVSFLAGTRPVAPAQRVPEGGADEPAEAPARTEE
ncbi:M48 family metallopeptidase [Actinoplanes sp. NPDC023714]|uniref:M48 family metallopeptidase n=1 Tax=Actinoplanes sp. NPDC023714 TaxID=3154322 RepID=UPI0034051F17